MAVFSLNKPVTTNVPTVVVDAGLPVGRQRFRLVVVDNAGNPSRADEVVVTIQRQVLTTGPTVTPLNPTLPILTPRSRRTRSDPP